MNEVKLLQQSAIDCLVRLRNAEKAKGGVVEAEALDGLHKELVAASRALIEACTKGKLLLQAGVPVASPFDVAKQKQVIANVLERFSEKPTAATLKHGKRWPTLISAVEDAARSVDATLKVSWATYVGSNLFAGPPPEEEERSLARTPKNRQFLDNYRRLFKQFAALRIAVPATPTAISDLKTLSEQLAAIQFERTVPVAVRDFLDAASTTTGAPLNLLTDAVMKWLIANDLSESYVIRARIS